MKKCTFERASSRSMALVLLLVIIIMATAQFDPFPFQERQALRKAKNFQPIEVLVLENPLTLLRGQGGSKWGPEVDRLADFAQYTGLKLKIISFQKTESFLAALQKGRGQIAIARWPLQISGFEKGPSFEEMELGLFCHKRVGHLQEKAPSRILKSRWPLKPHLQKIQNGEADCFLSEEQEGLFATQPYLSIQKMDTLKTPEHYSWQIRNHHKDLQILVHSWFRKSSRLGLFSNFSRRFQVTLTTLNSTDIRTFYQRVLTHLPEYSTAFHEIAKQVQLPWTLISAVAYQESQWNHQAVSYTGVKGLMQLTQQTAEHMGVSDREDPYQSIWGGARYLKFLWNQWPEVKNVNDRMMITLASYNIGTAHMFDVMELIKKEGRNPHSWSEIEKALPRLEEESVWSELPYGYARGTETVSFVNRTFSFYQLMSLER